MGSCVDGAGGAATGLKLVGGLVGMIPGVGDVAKDLVENAGDVV